jgi:hypothetical protein
VRRTVLIQLACYFCLPQEVHDAVAAQRAADANAQRRCGLMFELSVNLERLLEFLASQLPAAFRCVYLSQCHHKYLWFPSSHEAAETWTSLCNLQAVVLQFHL